jgi:hypothetical protein
LAFFPSGPAKVSGPPEIDKISYSCAQAAHSCAHTHSRPSRCHLSRVLPPPHTLPVASSAAAYAPRATSYAQSVASSPDAAQPGRLPAAWLGCLPADRRPAPAFSLVDATRPPPRAGSALTPPDHCPCPTWPPLVHVRPSYSMVPPPP